MSNTNTTKVRVATRIRPILPGIDNKIADNSPITSCVIPIDKHHIGYRFVDSHSIQQQQYKFDAIYDSNATQEDIFSNEVSTRLHETFDGKNATLLCYGPTGSGKTFTCVGTDGDIGMIPRTIELAIRRSQERKEESQIQLKSIRKQYHPTNQSQNHIKSLQLKPQRINNNIHNTQNGNKMKKDKCRISFHKRCKGGRYDCKLRLSCLEIYKEKVFDLLTHKKSDLKNDLPIRFTHDKGIVVQGLSEQPLTTMDQFYKYYETALENRRTAFTQLNAHSSRSHAIYILHIEQTIKWPTKVKTMYGKFSIVDLAGSENNKKTGNTGDRLTESAKINTSLFVLGHVIDALNSHQLPPYRNSKLTRLLSDALGGKACSTMICCVSQSLEQSIQTRNCLAFASNTRKIENSVVQQIQTTNLKSKPKRKPSSFSSTNSLNTSTISNASNASNTSNMSNKLTINESKNTKNKTNIHNNNNNVGLPQKFKYKLKSKSKSKSNCKNQIKSTNTKENNNNTNISTNINTNTNNSINHNENQAPITHEQLAAYQKQWQQEYESKIEEMMERKVRKKFQMLEADRNKNNNSTPTKPKSKSKSKSNTNTNEEKEPNTPSVFNKRKPVVLNDKYGLPPPLTPSTNNTGMAYTLIIQAKRYEKNNNYKEALNAYSAAYNLIPKHKLLDKIARLKKKMPELLEEEDDEEENEENDDGMSEDISDEENIPSFGNSETQLNTSKCKLNFGQKEDNNNSNHVDGGNNNMPLSEIVDNNNKTINVSSNTNNIDNKKKSNKPKQKRKLNRKGKKQQILDDYSESSSDNSSSSDEIMTIRSKKHRKNNKRKLDLSDDEIINESQVNKEILVTYLNEWNTALLVKSFNTVGAKTAEKIVENRPYHTNDDLRKKMGFTINKYKTFLTKNQHLFPKM